MPTFLCVSLVKEPPSTSDVCRFIWKRHYFTNNQLDKYVIGIYKWNRDITNGMFNQIGTLFVSDDFDKEVIWDVMVYNPINLPEISQLANEISQMYDVRIKFVHQYKTLNA